jgi:antirestriction protein
MTVLSAAKSITKPQAWVGCLGCYNGGNLIGEWLDGETCADTEAAGLSKTSIYAGTDIEYQRCRRCGSDQFWVFDHDDYGGFLAGECSPIEAQRKALEIIEIMADLGEDGDFEAFQAWCANEPTNTEPLTDRVDKFRDAFRGRYDEAVDYVEDLLESELNAKSEDVRKYFDRESYLRDLEFGGDIWTAPASEGVYVFSSTT